MRYSWHFLCRITEGYCFVFSWSFIPWSFALAFVFFLVQITLNSNG